MSLFPKFQFKNRTPANPANLANPHEATANQATIPDEHGHADEREPMNAAAHEQVANPANPANLEAENTGIRNFRNPVEPVQAPLEPPASKDRLCYQCGHFQRSPYSYPLGLCQQHGNRIQHNTSQPTQFGCGEFTFRQASDDSKTCIECRHYNPLSTMCSQVNTGCPYPSMPPCSGDKFQNKLKVIQSNKEVTK